MRCSCWWGRTGSAFALPAAVSAVSGGCERRRGRGGWRCEARSWVRVGGLPASGAALRVRNGLVVAQVSLALSLLRGAGLMIRSLDRLTSVDPGFDSRDVSTFQVSLPAGTYGSAYDLTRGDALARRLAFYDRLL